MERAACEERKQKERGGGGLDIETDAVRQCLIQFGAHIYWMFPAYMLFIPDWLVVKLMLAN